MRLHSLTTRFVLTLLLTTAVPFLAFGWFVRGGMQQSLDEQVVRVLLLDQAELLAERIDTLLERVYRDCALMEGAAGRAFDEQRPDLLEKEFGLIPGADDLFQLVVLVDGDGTAVRRVESVRLDRQRSEARRRLQPPDFGGEQWFASTVVEGHGLYWVDRHLSPLLHENSDRVTRDPSEYSLGLAFQVPGDFAPRGCVYALISWSQFQLAVERVVERLRETADYPHAEAHLCAADGTVLASSDRSLYSLPIEPVELRREVAAPEPPSAVVRFGASAALAAVAPSGQGFDWRCVVTVPEAEAFAQSRAFGRVLLIVTAVIALVLVVWSWFASRAILRPVRRLAGATARVARGDLSTRVPVRGRDELSDLGRSFNVMAEELSTSRERLRQAERQAAWAEMARQVAHEIKNPLTPMRMSAQLLEKARREGDPRLPELVERLTRTVVQQTESLARIASDFRQFAGNPQRRLERVAADTLLDEAEADFAAVVEQGRPELVFDRGAGDAWLEVDRGEMRRVFLNLVQNAVEAAGEGGSVRVSSRTTEDGVEFAVRDDGPGIPDEVRERLFEPYFTTRSSGTGLGLAICRRIVESHGGSIRLAEGRAGATEFRFTLPSVAPAGGPESPAPPSVVARAEGDAGGFDERRA